MKQRRIRKPIKAALMLATLAWVFGSGPSVMAANELGGHGDKGCSKCHVPHNAAEATDVPLWNPEQTTTTLNEPTYTSDTMQAAEAGSSVITGVSLLCLSCHDGSHSSSGHAFGTGKAMGSLARTHPIGITYDNALFLADGELVDPATLEPGVLSGGTINEQGQAEGGKVQCSSCHDPHSSADQTEPDKYLRWAYLDNRERIDGVWTGDTLSDDFCRHCHVK